MNKHELQQDEFVAANVRQFLLDLEAKSLSTNYMLYQKVRFERGGPGGVTLSDEFQSSTDEAKAKLIRVHFDSMGGRYAPAAELYLEWLQWDIPEEERVKLSVDNCLLYEMGSKMSDKLCKSVADALTASGWTIVCKGFAVRKEVAKLFMKDAMQRFTSLVEMRSYFRSLITTPAQYLWPKGVPVFAGILKNIGWDGNDGGAIFSNGLFKAHQNRVATREDASSVKGLLKGLITAAHICSRWVGDGEANYNSTHGWVHENVVRNRKVRKAAKKAARVAHKTGNYMFVVDGVTWSLGVYLAGDQAKGRGKKTIMDDMFLGLTGRAMLGYAISTDSPIGKGKISFGWQITELLDEDFIRSLFDEDGPVRQLIEEKFSGILERENPMIEEIMDLLGEEHTAQLMSGKESINSLKTLGKKLTKLLSNGLGLKCHSKYVQMMHLGGDYMIDGDYAFKKGQLMDKPFFGRTPNQMHDTIMQPVSFRASFLHGLLSAKIADVEDGNNVNHFLDSYLTHTMKESTVTVARKFLADLRATVSNDEEYVTKMTFILAMMPTVKAGCPLVDTTLQMKVCGDNDGDKNMISYGKLQKAVAANIVAKHPPVLPQKEAGKRWAVAEFDPCITNSPEEGFYKEWEAWTRGEENQWALCQRFLNAPGSTPGIGNVGAVTQCAAAPVNHCHWAVYAGEYTSTNPTARLYSDKLFSAQQPALDKAKHQLPTPSDEHISDSFFYAGIDEIIPGGQHMTLHQRVLVHQGGLASKIAHVKYAGVRASEHDPERLATVVAELIRDGHNVKAYEGNEEWYLGAAKKCNYYTIQGHPGVNYFEYRDNPQLWTSASELVPHMVTKGKQTSHIEMVGPQMYESGALYTSCAWRTSAINFGLSGILSYENMNKLQKYTKDGEAETNWEGLHKELLAIYNNEQKAGIEHVVDPVSMEVLKQRWVWPEMVKDYLSKTYRDDNSLSPSRFRLVRDLVRETVQDVLQVYGIEDPESALADSGVDIPLELYSNSYYDDESYKGCPPWDADGWENVEVLRNLYRGYVNEATKAEASKSQSERTQVDSVASGADQKRFLKAAFSGDAIRSLNGIRGLNGWLKKWRKAFVTGGNKSLSSDKQKKLLAGLLATGVKAICKMQDNGDDDNAEAIQHLIDLAKIYGQKNVLKLGEWDEYRAFKEEHCGGTGSKDKRVLRIKAEECNRLLKVEGLASFITREVVLNKEGAASRIETWLNSVGEDSDSSYKLIEFISVDFMGALEEAWKDVDRGDKHQDSYEKVQELFEVVHAVRDYAEVDETIAELNETVLDYIHESRMSIIAHNANLQNVSLETLEDYAVYYGENRNSIFYEWSSEISPVISFLRMLRTVKDVVENDDLLVSDRWLDEWKTKIYLSCFGEHGVYEDGERVDIVEHLLSSMSVEMPVSLRARFLLGLNLDGFSIQTLGGIPAGFKYDYDPDEDESEIATRKGYVDLYATWMIAATEHFGIEKVRVWVEAQLVCGTGHVSKADDWHLAYGLLHEYSNVDTTVIDEASGEAVDLGFEAYHHKCELVLQISEYFLSMYECFKTLTVNYFMEDEEDATLTHYILWPSEMGAKPKFNGWLEESYQEGSGDGDGYYIDKNPYKLFRAYAFGMSGEGNNQQTPEVPQHTEEYMESVLWGNTVGCGKYSFSEYDNKSGNRSYDRHNISRSGHQAYQRQGGDSDWYLNRHTNINKKETQGWRWSSMGDYPLFDGVVMGDEDSEVEFPCLLQVAINGMSRGSDNSLDQWRWSHYLLALSPSSTYNFLGSCTDEAGDLMRERNKMALSSIYTSSIRSLIRLMAGKVHREMEIVEAKIVYNNDFDINNYTRVMELLAGLTKQ